MSISTEITRLQTAKADIKSAIEEKGVTVPSSAKLDTYDDYIAQISSATLTIVGSGEYHVGDLVKNDLTVYLGTEEVTDKCTFTPSTFTTAGVQTVTVSLGGSVEGTIEVEVSSLQIVSWSTGTPEQLKGMLDAHYSGIINIHDYWTVGDERSVSLGAIASSGTANGVSWSVGESQSAQTVTMVLMDTNKYDLVAGGKCAFVVGQKNGLTNKGYMNSSNTNAGSWNSCARRNWCNGGYWNAIPSDLRQIFKQFKTVTASEYNASTTKISNDYFALFAEKEIFGSRLYSNQTEANALSQISYYTTSANRIKKQGDSGSASRWWGRSPASDGSTNFCSVYSDGSAYSNGASSPCLLAPFGCI